MEVFRIDDNHDPTLDLNPPLTHKPPSQAAAEIARKNVEQTIVATPSSAEPDDDPEVRINRLLEELLRLSRHHSSNNEDYPTPAYRTLINTLRSIVHGFSHGDGPCNLHLGEGVIERHIRCCNEKWGVVMERFVEREMREVVENLMIVASWLKDEEDYDSNRLDEMVKMVEGVVKTETKRVFEEHGRKREREEQIVGQVAERKKVETLEEKIDEDADAAGEVVMDELTVMMEEDNPKFEEPQQEETRIPTEAEKYGVTTTFDEMDVETMDTTQPLPETDTNKQTSGDELQDHPPAQDTLPSGGDPLDDYRSPPPPLTTFSREYISQPYAPQIGANSPYQTGPSTPPPESTSSDKGSENERATSHSPLSNLAISPHSSQAFILHNRPSTPPQDSSTSPPPRKFRRVSLVDREPASFASTSQSFSPINPSIPSTSLYVPMSDQQQQQQDLELAKRSAAEQEYRYQQFQRHQEQQQRNSLQMEPEQVVALGYATSPSTTSRYGSFSTVPGAAPTRGSFSGEAGAGGGARAGEYTAPGSTAPTGPAGPNTYGSVGGGAGAGVGGYTAKNETSEKKDLNWLKSLRVAELKEELRERGCPVSGLKADLTVRLGRKMGLM
ncbi:hypothetical protein EX30DRAFT_112973 [Ascodesmis nigricans]|uniref:SAP domain-containing protein n=1 Tax=Ascodesmis nigricans TaxID=341454 RepID=A0A4S2MQA8_9PEZI|nr:hypothetical protein EX30DRAFT_112973 [Ascodesmis nigricans]